MPSVFLTRKFLAATGTAALMAACWVLCQWLPLAREYYGTLVTGLGVALGSYTAGNVAQDHVMKNATSSTSESTVETVKHITATGPAPQPSQAQPHQAEPVE